MLSITEIRTTAVQALRKGGLSLAHAETQLDLLLDAEMRGVPSHGLLRLPRVIERVANGATDPEARGAQTWRGHALLDVDGQHGLGPVVALSALETAKERVAETGSCVVAIRNCDHLGMLAYYAERLAREGKVLLGLTVSEALVHPYGGRHAMIGTNPITIGVPAEPLPFVFDMATSLVSMGKIHDHAHRGVPIPEGWALDAEGNPTTDPNAAKLGSIAPFGGAKGYGLGLAFEVLVSALTGSAIGTAVKGTLDSTEPCNKGDLFVVMEPAPSFMALVSGFLEDLRQSTPADPASPVRIPGDRATHTREKAGRDGLHVATEVWQRIRALS
ncbi:Ldh family oxidoreductase [Pseudomonas sp. GX19020]|uniref:Ldh family oxidoreductase n=1 Tax=Pseudomonas sp. GX19020 TaxID=2942277 RepID=UPI002019DFC2|nr:Ldh family oxidoreductase [Pseudomonas sp. GX19020]MCL4068123.1 Ldh family oxidoreductase [Pseudomonas sp. GX19020]